MHGRSLSPGWTPLRAALAGVAVCLTAAAPADPLEDAIVPNGVASSFALADGAPNRHTLAVEAGEFLEAELREKSSRLGLALLDPTGVAVARREVSGDTFTMVRLLAVASVAGTYTLEVRTQSQGGPGSYELRVAPLRAAGPAERTRASADAAYADAVRDAGKVTPETRRATFASLDAAEKGFAEAGDRLGLALTWHQRGTVQLADVDPAATPSLERSLELFRQVPSIEGEASALSGLGRAKLRQGDLEAAGPLFEQALQRAGPGLNTRALLSFTGNAGIVLVRSGRYEAAIERFTKAVALADETGDARTQARTLTNLANAHKELGDYERASAIYDRALTAWRRASQRDGELTTLLNLGNMALLQHDVDGAQDWLEKALPLAAGAGGDEEGRLLLNLAGVHLKRGEHARALELAERSLALRRTGANPRGIAASLQMLSDCLMAVGEADRARKALDEALALQRSMGDPYLESETHMRLAEVQRAQGRLREALSQAEQAVSQIESLRASVTNPDLRATFVAVERVKYDQLVDILMRLHEQEPAAGHDAAALAVSERASARVLLDSLAEARADIRSGVDPALLARERAVQKRMGDGSARLSGLLARQAPADEVTRARTEIEAASEEMKQVQAAIRTQSPRYAALTQPEPPTLEQVRRDALDDETLLLEYFLGDERSVLWVVSRTELVSVTLPARPKIEAPARRLHERLTERQRTRGAAARAADESLRAESAALAEMVLGGIAPRLRTDWRSKRLLIVAPGALAYVPFAALPLPGASGRPLLDDHEVVHAPSASVLIAARREQAPATGRTVAVLADPVFEADDPRVRGAAAKPSPGTQPVGLGRAMRSLGRDHFARLPFSRAEATALASLVPERDLLRATDFAASRALVDEGALAERRIVHFATHGILDTAHPDLSGLVLSLVDAEGRPRDGFLRMQEIYNLRLPADLVVLSACQTALGREVRGEGLVGLTRGFLYAGARRVMASLWQVDDESTAELMRRFYRAHLREGQAPAAALRTAQAEMSRDRRFAAPFYWAAFTLTGDWR